MSITSGEPQPAVPHRTPAGQSKAADTHTPPTDSENTLVQTLGLQITELKKRHRTEVQALRDALEQAHGENLELRRELARRGASAASGPH
ncbi:hypothetical protein ACIHDR_49605 [Nocardia sp. NPDC052278]|uniref:hypothetical protein n=1 Tax=unclassified Nocardia TaxID=2637762 RepID=UPI0036B5B2C1